MPMQIPIYGSWTWLQAPFFLGATSIIDCSDGSTEGLDPSSHSGFLWV